MIFLFDYDQHRVAEGSPKNISERFFERDIDNGKLKNLLPQTILSDGPTHKYHNSVYRTERFKNSFWP